MALWINSALSFAMEPEKIETIVYQARVHTGKGHKLSYLPPQTGDIYLLAEQDNLLDPRTTLVYYWLLTREYFESWEKLDVKVEGTLEVVKDEQVLITFTPKKSVLFYPNGVSAGKSIVLQGSDAEKKVEEHQRLTKAFNRKILAHNLEMLRYEQAIKDLIRKKAKSALPQAPIQPVPPKEFVSAPIEAFLLNFPEGQYEIRMRSENGAVIEGSERIVIFFSPRKTHQIAYQIVPEERWTERVPAESPDTGIYSEPGKSLYLIPFVATVFDEWAYHRLMNPQATGRQDVFKWVHDQPLEDLRLVLWENDKKIREIAWLDYRVEQTEGPELGYQFEVFSPSHNSNKSPMLSAFALEMTPNDQGKTYQMTLENPTTGKVVEGSQRELRVIDRRRQAYGWVVAFFPVVAAIGIIGWRRYQSS